MRLKASLFLVLLIVLLVAQLQILQFDFPPNVYGDVTICTGTKDAYLDQLNPDTNYGTGASIYVRSYYKTSTEQYQNRRSLLEFDISPITAGATINSAVVSLYCSAASTGRTYEFRRVTGEWTETDVTWNTEPATTATHLTTPSSPSATGWYNVTVTLMVQDARAGGTTFGVRIKDYTEDSTTAKLNTFNSKEGANDPFLEVDWTAPTPTYSDVASNTTLAGQPCQFSVLWNDGTNVSGFIFGTNNTGAWANETWVAFTTFYNTTAAWSNVTKTLNSTVGVRVEWNVWCNNTSNVWSNLETQYLITTALVYPTYSNIATNTTRSDYNTQDIINFSVYWTCSDGLLGYQFGSNNTGTWVDDPVVNWTGSPTSAWSNVTKTLTNNTGSLVVWKIYAESIYTVWNNTGDQTLRVWGVKWREFGNGRAMSSGYVIGDADNDGLNEIVYGYGEYIMQREWDGTTFVKNWMKIVYDAGSLVTGFDVCDSNGDGKNEVVVITFGGQFFVYNWTTNPPTTLWSKSYDSVCMKGYDVLGTDVNGDGKDDLVLSFDQRDGSTADPELLVLVWNATSASYDEYPYNAPLLKLNPAATVGDVDQDGRKEIICGMGDHPIGVNTTLCILEWNGTGLQLEWSTILESYVYGVWIGDNDQDSYLEISAAIDPISIGGGSYNQSVYLFSWNGTAYVQEAKITVVDSSPWGIAEALTVNDVDNDNLMETVFISNLIYSFYWNGTAYTQKSYSPINLTAEGWSHITLGYWATPLCQIGQLLNDGINYMITNNFVEESMVYVWTFPQLPLADVYPPTYSNIGYNSTVGGSTCSFSILWNDTYELDTAIFSTNNTGSWQNQTVWTDGNTTSKWANITITLDLKNDVFFRWYCNDTRNNWGDTGIRNFTLTEHFFSVGPSQTFNIAFITLRIAEFWRNVVQSISAVLNVARLVDFFRFASQAIALALQGIGAKIAIYLVDAILTISTSFQATRLAEWLRAVTQSIAMMFESIRLGGWFRSASQTITASLSANRLIDITRTTSLLLGISVITLKLAQFVRASSQTFSFGFATTGIANFVRSVTQSITATLSTQRLGEMFRAASQSIAFALQAVGERIALYLRDATLTIATSFQASRLAEWIKAVSQSVSLTLQSARLSELWKSASQTIAMSLVGNRLIDVTRTATETFTLSLVGSRLAEFVRTASQAVNVNFAVAGLADFFRTVSQAITATLNGQRLIEVTRLAVQTLTFSLQAIGERVGIYLRNVALTIATSLQGSRLAEWIKSASQTFTVGFAVASLADFARSASQTIATVLTGERMVDLLRSASQTITFTLQTIGEKVGIYLRDAALTITTAFQGSRLAEWIKATNQTISVTLGNTRLAQFVRSASQSIVLSLEGVGEKIGIYLRNVLLTITATLNTNRLTEATRQATQTLSLSLSTSRVAQFVAIAVLTITTAFNADHLIDMFRSASQSLNFLLNGERLIEVSRSVSQTIALTLEGFGEMVGNYFRNAVLNIGLTFTVLGEVPAATILLALAIALVVVACVVTFAIAKTQREPEKD